MADPVVRNCGDCGEPLYLQAQSFRSVQAQGEPTSYYCPGHGPHLEGEGDGHGDR